MKKKIFLVLGLFTMGLMSVVFVSTIETSNLKSLIANVEALALSSRESLDTSYTRTESKCTVNVGVKGKIKLMGGTILEAGASGEVSFDGKVVCGASGTLTCKPVECIDLYEVITK